MNVSTSWMEGKVILMIEPACVNQQAWGINRKCVSIPLGELTLITMKSLLFFILSAFLFSYAQENIPGKRAHHALVFDEGLQKVILTGGSTPLNGGSSFLFYDDVWSFDGATWKKEATTGDQRSGVTLAYDSKTKTILSMGGFSNRNTTLGDLRQWNGTSWTTLKDVPEMAAAEGGFVYDTNRNKFIAFGGSQSREVIQGTTWEWEGSAWKKIEGTNPEPRQAFAMVYDSKRKKTVVFGGMGKTPNDMYGNTWEFDGKTWTKVSDTGPAPRMSMGYAYDSKRGLLIIFGGASSSGILSDTWAWDGKAWKQLATTGPTARMMGYIAYDKKRDKTVLFGGRLGWPNDANDTWEFDGTSWREVK
jgi:hypothetical protein